VIPQKLRARKKKIRKSRGMGGFVDEEKTPHRKGGAAGVTRG